MNPYLAFAVAATTHLLRVSMTIAGDRMARSVRSRTVTALVTPAVLAAMVASALVVRHGHAATPPLREVVGVAFAVTRRTRNFGLALGVGMPVYWLSGLPGLG